MALFIAPESSFVQQTNYLLVKNPSFSSYTEIETEQKELTIEASGLLCAVLVDASLLGMGENLAVFNC